MMPLHGRIRLGIIGCGWVTQTWHLPVLRSLADVEVAAVADLDEAQAKRTAQRFTIPHWYGEGSALLKHPSLNAVAVCVPPQHHAEIASAALDMGKHVFIEKPLALNVNECDTLIEQAKRTSSIVMVGFNLRWHRLIRQAQSVLHEGTLGHVSMIRTVFTNGVYHDHPPLWRRLRTLGGGVLQDLGAHHFDLWRFLLRTEVKEISVISLAGPWDDETAVVTGRMANDVLVSGVFSAGTTDSHEIEIYGQTGRLRLSCYRVDGLEWYPPSRTGGVGARVKNFASKLKAAPSALASLRKGGEMWTSYRAQWRHFAQCIQQKIPAECSLEDGRRAVQIASAALESSSSGRQLTVN